MSDQIEGVVIEENGHCNFCNDHQPFEPYDESELIHILKKARRKGRTYDALVPLSGGKDSTYVLYLAVQKYDLNVLTYTYDNGFLSDFARENIASAVKACGVDHIWVHQSQKMLYELYRTALVESGEICGVCGVGIERSMLKVSEAYKTPLILLGHTANEENSFSSEEIYDQKRLKVILRKNRKIGKREIRRFLLYPRLNYISSFLFTKTGRFGKKVNMLYYQKPLSDKEISVLLKKEMNWVEPTHSDYTRHFDCIAEPFTNFVREERFGNSRRVPQLCNMIRNEEMTREEALRVVAEDEKKQQHSDFKEVLDALHLSEKEMDRICEIPPNVYGEHRSFSNQFFARLRALLKKNSH
ncbi:MAG: hypothetical protein CSA04_02430 [Bacteroidetes bacterium]|nr:MAG: hypothetical protein CSA04_02430 [Bacteroidota bacterium]